MQEIHLLCTKTGKGITVIGGVVLMRFKDFFANAKWNKNYRELCRYKCLIIHSPCIGKFNKRLEYIILKLEQYVENDIEEWISICSVLFKQVHLLLVDFADLLRTVFDQCIAKLEGRDSVGTAPN